MIMEIFYTLFSPFITVEQAERKQKIQTVIFQLVLDYAYKNSVIWVCVYEYFRCAFFAIFIKKAYSCHIYESTLWGGRRVLTWKKKITIFPKLNSTVGYLSCSFLLSNHLTGHLGAFQGFFALLSQM